MIRIIKKLFFYLKRKLFINKYKKSFRKKIRIAPNGCDLNENLLAFRYLCHQLEKTIKNKYDCRNVRGHYKYEKAKSILLYLENTEWIDSPDIKWGKGIIKSYELWKDGNYKNYTLNIRNEEKSSRDLKDIIYRRRSIRFWKSAPIPKHEIFSILEMGVMAPSSCNRQPYKFVVVENINKTLIDEGTGNKALISKAPYIIYITVDRRLHPEKFAPAIDAGMAAQNILLAIEYFGYGACPMYHCEPINQKKLREMLELDKHSYIYLAIPFGKPAERPNVPCRVPVEKITEFLKIDSATIASKM